MKIAILGATSQIASDLILGWAKATHFHLDLFARRPEAVSAWLARHKLERRFAVADFESFKTSDTHYDAIINFVGVGDPARAAAMGSSILDITRQYDDMALAYQKQSPDTRYLFLSSGAVYGSVFLKPASRDTQSQISINNLSPQEFYAVSKLYAEVNHRAHANRPIIDVRVFNIFSRTQDLSSKFFITDIVQSIIKNEVLFTSPDNIIRDFQSPVDFQILIEKLLSSPPMNTSVDCYSQAPVDKWTLLNAMDEWFGLRWEIKKNANAINATGNKQNYYSMNHCAAEFGYDPQYSSLESLRMEIGAILEQHH